jgi:hypothetical protein
MKINKKWLFTPKAHIILYGLLLIFTPFLMLRNYLQSAIGKLSRFSFQLGELEVPYLLSVIIIFLLIIIVINLRKILLRYIFAGIICLLFIYLGQLFTDYYFDHRFYDLQHNWHYVAYGIYSFIAYRYFRYLGKPIEKSVLYIYLSALALSTFDEGIQVFISNRIFDISDIAKDGWGAVIGSVFLYYGLFIDEAKNYRFAVWHKTMKEYLTNPKTILFWEIIFNFILIITASLLANIKYWYVVVLITLVSFSLIFLLIHSARKKLPRIIIISLIVVLLIIQGISFVKHRNGNIISDKCGLIVYKGIPIPYFDVMIFPDGSFRLVDKKDDFNKRDLTTIYSRVDDILLIGSGYDDTKIKGFPEDFSVQFIFNHITQKPLQVIILPSDEACNEFNRLKKEGKNVLFIIHNSC